MFSQIKDTKHIKGDFYSVAWAMRLWGAGGAKGVKKKFFKHGYVVYQIDGDDEQNRMLVKKNPRVKLLTLG